MPWVKGESMHRGEENPGAKLTAADVTAIRKVRAGLNNCRFPPGDSRSIMALALKYDVSPALISSICHGKQWRHL